MMIPGPLVAGQLDGGPFIHRNDPYLVIFALIGDEGDPFARRRPDGIPRGSRTKKGDGSQRAVLTILDKNLDAACPVLGLTMQRHGRAISVRRDLVLRHRAQIELGVGQPPNQAEVA